MMAMSKEELIAFEDSIAETFNSGQIHAPVHLDNGNEDALIEIFRDIGPNDWVCGTWRMHYKCLLKGVPWPELLAEITKGRSISLCFPKYRIISSAIAGGILPIAVGIAMAMKKTEAARVNVFVGDMMAESGVFHECVRYAANHMLNMRFIIEDNGLSVCTPTESAWGRNMPAMMDGAVIVSRYQYRSKYPHAGAGKRIQF